MQIPAKSITARSKAITSRSVPFQTGSAGSMDCPSSCRARLPGRSATLSGCASPGGSPPSAPCWRQICGMPSGTPTTLATSSCSWSIRGMRSIMAAGSASACGGRSDFSTPAGEIRCSQRTESVLPSRATWNRSKRGCVLSCLLSLSLCLFSCFIKNGILSAF